MFMGRRDGDEPANTRVVEQDEELDYLPIISLSSLRGMLALFHKLMGFPASEGRIGAPLFPNVSPSGLSNLHS